MKKVYSILLLALIGIIASNAEAKTLTFKTDAASSENVYVRDPANGYNPVSITEEGVTLTVDDNASLPVGCNDGYYIATLTTQSGYKTLDYSAQKKSDETFSAQDFADNDVITITTHDGSAVASNMITINGEPGSYYVSYKYESISPDENGTVTIKDWEQWGDMTIYATDGYILSSVKDQTGIEYVSSGSAYVYFWYLPDNPVFTVECIDKSTIEYSHFTVSATGSSTYIVNMYEANTSDYVYPENEAKIIDFLPGAKYYISSSYGYMDKYIYRITVNGETLKESYSNSWEYYPKDGDVVVIETDFPAIDIPVKFTVAEGVSTNIIREIRVNNQLIDRAEWSADGYTVRCGASVSVSFDYDNFGEIVATCNGESVSNTYYSFNATEESGYEITVTGVALKPYEVKIICLYPDALTIYKGYSSEKYELNFVDNIASINVAMSQTKLNFAAEGDYILKGIKVYEDPNAELYYGTYDIPGDCTIEVELEPLKRELTGVIYVEDCDWGYYNFYLNKNYYTNSIPQKEIERTPGYTVFNFADFDVPFYLSAQTTGWVNGSVYVNDELSECVYGSYTALENFKDGDVIKVFSKEQDTHAVNYTIADGVNAAVRHDHIRMIENPSSHNVLPGTLIHISAGEAAAADAEASDNTPIVVTVNGTKATADENGIYAIEVNEDTDIEIASNASTGIADITVDAANGEREVYNLQGIKVNSNELPAGIYIINGKKTLVK